MPSIPSFLIDLTSLKSGITHWIDTFKSCTDPGHPGDRGADRRAEALRTVRGRMAVQIDLRRPEGDQNPKNQDFEPKLSTFLLF